MIHIGEGYYLTMVLWLVTLAALFGRAWGIGRPVAGLALAYWLNLALIHFLSGLIQGFPWYESVDKEESVLGFEVTGYTMLGLLLGTTVIAPLIVPPQPRQEPAPASSPRRLGVTCIWAGLLSTFVVMGFLRIPSLGAILSGGLPLALTGFCLLWWEYWRAGERMRAWRTLAFSAIIPALILGLYGFMGFGITATLQLASFVAVFYRPRRTVIVTGLVVLVLGLSLYPVYMRVRTQIREAVWGGASIGERIEKISLLATEWEWFDSESGAHLAVIDARLNQNVLIGKSVRRTTDGLVAFADGETLSSSFLALIPRIVWPDKPQYAGSGGLVSRFTGLKFAVGTSVGIGHVMELYINFGTIGVFCGFLLIGTILGVIDLVAGLHMAEGRWEQFALWYMVGLAMLNVGGNFAEMTVSIVGWPLLCLFVSRMLVSQASAPLRPAVSPGT
jgi:hypothetical protein